MDLADLLECSICLEQLDESNKVLPCQHTFCTKCLKDIYQKKSELLCPECRKPVEVAIDSLPPNILANRILEGMTRKPSHSKAGPVSQEHRPKGHKDPPHPLPALPLPKRPATKPDVTRKPPAAAPADDQTAPIMGFSDKTSHYSNVSSQSKKTATAKNDLALPLAPSTPPNNQALSTVPSAPKHSSQSSTAQVSSEPGKPAHSSAPKSSPPNLLSPIPGNLSTNPFLDLIQAEDTVKSISQSFSGLGTVQPAVPKSNILTHSNDHNLIESLPLPNKPAPRPPTSNLDQPPLSQPPKVPERPKHTLVGQESTKQWQLSPRALIQPPKEPNKSASTSNHPPASSATSTTTSANTNSKGTLFKAIFDYSAKQADELSLKKGEFYTVSEMCVDGWFKGQSLRLGKSGVFPGNHVHQVDPGAKSAKKTKEARKKSVQEVNLIDLSDEDGRRALHAEEGEPETDEERLEKLKKIRDTLRQNHQHNVVRAQAGAGSANIKTKGDRYRCIVAFPASSEYEIELQLGDVISLVKRRDDGWCKGTLHRTGKTGLFPASFVEKI